ncbi:hypothetical protein G7046_g6510 [Stylonectria norvegica]|nr:hypothetical protein G7046_g6510 [Stylonectria norvegica]
MHSNEKGNSTGVGLAVNVEWHVPSSKCSSASHMYTWPVYLAPSICPGSHLGCREVMQGKLFNQQGGGGRRVWLFYLANVVMDNPAGNAGHGAAPTCWVLWIGLAGAIYVLPRRPNELFWSSRASESLA